MTAPYPSVTYGSVTFNWTTKSNTEMERPTGTATPSKEAPGGFLSMWPWRKWRCQAGEDEDGERAVGGCQSALQRAVALAIHGLSTGPDGWLLTFSGHALWTWLRRGRQEVVTSNQLCARSS